MLQNTTPRNFPNHRPKKKNIRYRLLLSNATSTVQEKLTNKNIVSKLTRRHAAEAAATGILLIRNLRFFSSIVVNNCLHDGTWQQFYRPMSLKYRPIVYLYFHGLCTICISNKSDLNNSYDNTWSVHVLVRASLHARTSHTIVGGGSWEDLLWNARGWGSVDGRVGDAEGKSGGMPCKWGSLGRKKLPAA